MELGTSARARSLCALALVLSLCSSQAQTNTSPPGNRYLFVVETSRSMQSRSEGTLRAVQQLLNSGMGGQLRRGDTLGVWTYNDTLFAGKFRLQLWSPETHASTVANVVGFLQQQTYEKNGRLEKVLPALDRVIKDSPFLTIILVSGGEQEIHGTPFDKQINETYDLWQKKQQKARLPVLTALRAKAGQLTDFSVSAAPWPMDMPPLPKELQLAENTRKKPAPATPAPKPAIPTAPNLVISGKQIALEKAKAASPTTNTVPDETAKTQSIPPPSLVQEKTTTAPLETSPPANQPPAPAPAKSTAAPIAPPVQPEPAPTPAPAPSLTSEPEPETAKTPEPKLSNLAPAKFEGPSLPQTPIVKSEPIASPPSTPGQPPSSPDTAAPVTAQEASPQTATATSKPDSVSVRASIENPGSRLPSSSPTVAVAPEPFLSRKNTWTILIPLVVAACALVVVWARRSRFSRQASLITRSLEREKRSN